MTDPNAAFTGSIPENYDRYLGPVLFEGYARALAREFGDRPIRIPLHAFVLTASAGRAGGR